jgi:predicted AAA+ superfamily ATPase
MLERETIKKIKEKIQNNKIVLVLGSQENLNEEEFIQEIGLDENFKLLDISNKKTKKTVQAQDPQGFQHLFEENHFVIIKEAQLLSNFQELIESVLFSDLAVNLLCLCSFDPVIDELLMEALLSQDLVIKATSPSFKEIAKHYGLIQIEKNLEQRLIFGNQEKVFGKKEDAIAFLEESAAQILKSTLNSKERINKTENLRRLLQNISLSVGNHVSFNELGITSDLDNETVERYVNLLVKSQILIKIPAFSTDLKYELKKTHCLYFTDNGIRNAFIKNFNDLEVRSDADNLWKNWFVAEKLKKQKSLDENHNLYFWITHTKQKVDLIEIVGDKKIAYQMKWNKKEKNKFPKSFINSYPETRLNEVNRSTYWSFLSKD